jgi:hypothetical protein
MGTSNKNQEFQYSAIPGPGLYKIPGFSDLILRDVEKKQNLKNKLIKKKIDGSHPHDMNNMFDMLDRINSKDIEEVHGDDDVGEESHRNENSEIY